MMQARVLDGRRILVVEDEYLVAQHLSDVLEDAGAIVLGPVGWMDEALAWIDQARFSCDGAVLDVNLHGHPSYPIADALTRRGVRFVFVTGYDAGALAPAYRDCPRCQKPLEADAVLKALAWLSS